MIDKNISIILDCDDDVVLFEKDTFKVSRLKELTIREARKNWKHTFPIPDKEFLKFYEK